MWQLKVLIFTFNGQFAHGLDVDCEVIEEIIGGGGGGGEEESTSEIEMVEERVKSKVALPKLYSLQLKMGKDLECFPLETIKSPSLHGINGKFEIAL
ncbi:Hypothetical predicted protein [Olea europaea subsp. europaea]|uniref:Uncharacterized protein n=1 Tax=Olea europaea subsp. europaea TaxID=158383 RepID=A0A8S0SX52_OLEEU|nr:Hypothetical predicted protein [Olea europaea subsp. europaea]